ncbi:MAG: DEAD/DEAH box helicase [Bdellovibrionales bacterium]|nr:DEAD/DEAH box helicase [Bdellovibrionales bacterium]
MQDDTTLSDSSEQTSTAFDGTGPTNIQHCYFEVDAELLAKPNALCDLIQMENGPATIIFCNSPSDADFVDIMLKKRGLKSKKLIGHIPAAKVASALDEIDKGEKPVLVMTDVSAEALNGAGFDFIINYSVPPDPDTYQARIEQACAKSTNCKVVCLVGSLDFSNFHYLKKIIEAEFKLIEPPSPEELAKVQLKALANEASSAKLSADNRLDQLAGLLVDSDALSMEERLSVVRYLLERATQQNSNQQRSADDEREEGRGRGRGRDQEGGRRNGRGNNRRNDEEFYDDEDGFEGAYSDSDKPRERKPRPIVDRDIRIYIGHGRTHDFSGDEMSELLQSALEGSEIPFDKTLIKRFTSRELYSFVDVPEKASETILNNLQTVHRSNGESLVACKTVSIAAPRAVDGIDADEADVDDEGDFTE